MTWSYYGYYELVRKSSFDCLKELVCPYVCVQWNITAHGIPGYPPNNSSTPYIDGSYDVYYSLLPLADIKSGVVVRGDALVNTGTAGDGIGSTTNAFGSFHPQDSYLPSTKAGVLVIWLHGTRFVANSTLRPANRTLENSAYPYHLKYTEEVNAYGQAAQRVTFNPDTFVATLDATLDSSVFADFATKCQQKFGTDFPAQSLGLSDLAVSGSYGKTFTIQIDPANSSRPDPYSEYTQTVRYSPTHEEGDPLTSPLFRIAFN